METRTLDTTDRLVNNTTMLHEANDNIVDDMMPATRLEVDMDMHIDMERVITPTLIILTTAHQQMKLHIDEMMAMFAMNRLLQAGLLVLVSPTSTLDATSTTISLDAIIDNLGRCL